MQFNFQAVKHSFATWDELNGVVPCVCYNDGQRRCNAYAVKLAIPSGGSIDTCLSHSVPGNQNIICKSCAFRHTLTQSRFFFRFVLFLRLRLFIFRHLVLAVGRLKCNTELLTLQHHLVLEINKLLF